ncbi:cytochrome c biogenesis protein ResB [Desulforamulus ruminis]|uniref:cytochrome c biogenesis protein ResB n=1 Tax=Desulforamulus ruminis TaxID=1564 RepID=UPI002FDB40B2
MFKSGNDSNPGENEFFRFLFSMKTGLFLLLLLAALASIGSFISQGQEPAYYVKHQGKFLGSIILMLSLNKVYSSWWFIGLGVFLCINVLFCSVQRMKKMTDYKQFGSVILHLSILVIFTGSLISGLTGNKSYIELGVGDSVQLADRNFPNIKLKVTDFKIDFYENHEPKQYQSKFSLTTEAGKKVQGQISVNHPFTRDGIKIYQQSYGYLIHGQVEVAGKAVSFELANGKEILLDAKQKLHLKILFIPDFDEQGKTLQSKTPMLRNPKLVCALVKGKEILAARDLAPGETKELRGYPVTFYSYRYFTGLEVKRDKGTAVVFSGFALLLGGLAVRYLVPYKNKRRGEKP